MDRRASALELREPGARQQGAEPEELDVSTPLSFFDPYKPDDGAEADAEAVAAAAANGSPRPDAGADGSPRVRIGLTATVQFQEEAAPSSPAPSAEAEAPAAAGGEDHQQLALPASPRDEHQPARNRFVISFQDVQSPEKAEGFKPQPPLAGRRKRALPSPARRVEEEGLGDDWANRPWKEPSVEAARTARRRALVSQGRLPLWSTDPDDLLFLGPGVSLYLYYVRAIALFCLLASILHVPHLIIAWSGGMLEPYSIGDATAGAFMAAGHMVSYPGMDTEAARWCDRDFVDTIFAPNVSCTEPVIQLLGRRSTVYIKADHASYLITACDALSCLLFIATWLLLVRKHRAVHYAKDYATSVVGTKDYAIAVRGLPEDAREEEIVTHFNRLYALNGGDEDWTYPGSCCGLVNAKTYQRTSESIVDITGKVIGTCVMRLGRLESAPEPRVHRFHQYSHTFPIVRQAPTSSRWTSPCQRTITPCTSAAGWWRPSSCTPWAASSAGTVHACVRLADIELSIIHAHARYIDSCTQVQGPREAEPAAPLPAGRGQAGQRQHHLQGREGRRRPPVRKGQAAAAGHAGPDRRRAAALEGRQAGTQTPSPHLISLLPNLSPPPQQPQQRRWRGT